MKLNVFWFQPRAWMNLRLKELCAQDVRLPFVSMSRSMIS